VGVPKRSVIIKKAIQEYEMYARTIRDKLFVGFMEKSGDRTVSENVTRKVL